MVPVDETFTNGALLVEKTSKFVSMSREAYWVPAFEYEVPSSNDTLTTGAGPVFPTAPDNVEMP